MDSAGTGLVYMQQRYYDPDVGGFISPDPIMPTPGNIYNFNRYAYANNNPIGNIDPDGRDDIVLFRPVASLLVGKFADHTALLTGNDKTGWVYQSKDGVVGGGMRGPSAHTRKNFTTRAAALKAAVQMGYTKAIFHGASAYQDIQARSAFAGAAHEEYGFFDVSHASNCGWAVAVGVSAQGILYPYNFNPKSQLKWAIGKKGEMAGWKPIVLPSSSDNSEDISYSPEHPVGGPASYRLRQSRHHEAIQAVSL